ncbi:MAG TPA: molybdopterin-dependent oxidoreductase [Pseudonocardia sp.]|jgi:DMSO/TMAO reductase YedYZ molybdopterin-dependent catalytic subunit|nr:molybdopterin-dependent oxidoreductase [Pseudonocardia sp.]
MAPPKYGFPAPLWRAVDRFRPPGIDRIQAWRSPLRGPWLTSVFGAVLLASLPIVIVTGLLDYIAYGPQFGQAIPGDVGWLHLPFFQWPSRPSWLFRLTQGLHVGLGLIIVPVVLAKLWSVVPRLFSWPPARSFAQVAERLSLLALVGGILFEMATGILNIQYDYVFGFNFYPAHYYGAWVFMVGFVVHTAIKLPTMLAGLRLRSLRAELRTPLAQTTPEATDPDEEDSLVAANPAPPTVSRRGALALVGGGSVLVAALTVGQTVGGPLRSLALLLPRGRSYGDGPNDFQVNRPAGPAGITATDVGASWRLSLAGGTEPVLLTLDDLYGLPRHTVDLPLACVEGWSVVQTWSGVRLRDLAARAGVPAPAAVRVRSTERVGAFASAWLTGDLVTNPDALLATHVNGAVLSLDHGFPARIIGPALPGVHCTKWVRSLEFRRS